MNIELLINDRVIESKSISKETGQSVRTRQDRTGQDRTR